MCCTELCTCPGSTICMNPFRDLEKMTEILKATRKTMQISGVFIMILLLNEVTYDFFSLCRVNEFLSSDGCQSNLVPFS